MPNMDPSLLRNSAGSMKNMDQHQFENVKGAVSLPTIYIIYIYRPKISNRLVHLLVILLLLNQQLQKLTTQIPQNIVRLKV